MKTIAAQRQAGPVLLVDSGDALYPATANLQLADAARAHLIAEAMGALHYDAMAVGERDLARGLGELQKLAAEQHLPLLAANLADTWGVHPFPGTRLVTGPGGGKAGVFAVAQLPPEALGGLRIEDPRAAAQAAIASLHHQGATWVVGLLHMNNADALRVADGLTGVDALIVSHDGGTRVLLGKPPAYNPGQKGKAVIKVTLDPGSGPIEDAMSQSTARNTVDVLNNTIHVLEQRQAAETKPEDKQAAEVQLVTLRQRRQAAQAAAGSSAGGRLAHEETITLGTEVAEDPQWAKRVAAEIAVDGRTPGH